MGVLADRQPGYKRGLVVLFLGTVTFVVGFATPHWSHFQFTLEGITIEGNFGLWVYCVATLGHSICTTFSVTDEGFMATKALECIALVGMFLAACYAVGVNFLVAKPRFSRLLEICTACAGTSGVAGAVVYVVTEGQDVTAVNKLYRDSGDSLDHYTVHWSFGLAIVGAVLVLIATFLIASYNKPLPDNQAAADTSVVFTTMAAPGNTPHHGGAAHAPYPLFHNQAAANTSVAFTTMAAPGNMPHYGGAAHAPYPGSNPYGVSVVLQQSGEPHPPARPAYNPASAMATAGKFAKYANVFTKFMTNISDTDYEEE